MIVKVLGAIDILAGVIFLMNGLFKNSLEKLTVIFGILILIKGLIFIKSLDFSSIADSILGIVIIFSAYNKINFFVVIFVSIFLLQKGIISEI